MKKNILQIFILIGFFHLNTSNLSAQHFDNIEFKIPFNWEEGRTIVYYYEKGNWLINPQKDTQNLKTFTYKAEVTYLAKEDSIYIMHWNIFLILDLQKEKKGDPSGVRFLYDFFYAVTRDGAYITYLPQTEPIKIYNAHKEHFYTKQLENGGKLVDYTNYLTDDDKTVRVINDITMFHNFYTLDLNNMKEFEVPIYNPLILTWNNYSIKTHYTEIEDAYDVRYEGILLKDNLFDNLNERHSPQIQKDQKVYIKQINNIIEDYTRFAENGDLLFKKIFNIVKNDGYELLSSFILIYNNEK